MGFIKAGRVGLTADTHTHTACYTVVADHVYG